MAGRWPRGRFVLNRKTSLIRNLIYWTPALGSYHTSTLRDFVRSKNGAFSGGSADPSWLSSAKFGGKLNFDGVDNRIELGSIASTDLLSLAGTEATIAIWCKPVSGGSTYQSVVSKQSFATGTNGYDVTLYDTAQTVRLQVNANILTSGISYGYDNWIHIVCVIRASGSQIFFNGSDTGASGASGLAPSATNNLVIGGQGHNPTNNNYIGGLGDIAIWNRALTVSEIWQLYRDPWSLYQPVVPRFVVAVSGGGGAQTVSLNELTLASSAQTLNIIPGAVTIILNELTLVGSVENITLVLGAVSILLTELTLASAIENMTIITGAVSIALNELTLASNVENISILTGVIILLNSLTLSSGTESLSILAGAVGISLNELTLASSIENINVSVTTLVLLATLTLNSSAESITALPGAVSITLDELTLASNAENITVTIGAIIQALFKGMYKGMYRGMQ